MKIALVGMGNIMFCDEGLGTYLAKYIETNYEIPESLEIVDGGLLGFGLMSYYQEFDKLLIVSTTSKDGSAGEIFRYSADDMLRLGKTRQSANEVEVAMMIEICSVKEDMAEIEFLTMVPDNIEDVKNDLSKTVLEKMPLLAKKTLEVLNEYGITLEQKDSVSFNDIVDRVANPSNIRAF